MNRSAASIQPGSGTVPARRNISHGVRAAAAAALSRAPMRLGGNHEAAAGDIGDFGGGVARAGIRHDHFGDQAGRRARNQGASVGTSDRSDSCVAMIALSMEP